MFKKVLFIIVTVVVLTLCSSQNIFAKRLLPRIQIQKTTSNIQKTATKGVTVLVTFREDRNAIMASFTNLKVAKEVVYVLSYKNSENIEQAVQSSLDVTASGPVVRELLFGTCSTNNVCQYDSDVHDAKLVVTTTLTTGRKVIRIFNLKVKK